MQSYEMLKLENQLCFPLYATAKEVVRLYTPFLREVGLTYTQYIAMMVIWEKRSLVVKELGKLLFLDTGTLTPLLRKLEQKGFIQLSNLPEDRRSILINVTPEGMKLRDDAVEIPLKVGACVQMDSEDAKLLFELTHKLLNQITKGDASNA